MVPMVFQETLPPFEGRLYGLRLANLELTQGTPRFRNTFKQGKMDRSLIDV